ncbi:MAG: hypothetical protein ACREX9_05020 [Gammaproteobacteria bacterium]
MHDIDRTLMEMDPEVEYEPELESDYEYDEFETPDTEAVFDEAEEMELAAELLAVSDEAELDHFWGGFLKKAGRALGKFVNTPTGQALKGLLKGAAKKYLPTVAGALGTAIGGPAGAVLGRQLGSQAGRIFGLELEGLSPEDQEFEMAKGMVRFGAEAAKNAALTPPSSSPQADAKAAAVEAAKQHAPGLLKPATSPPPYSPMMTRGSGRSGRWVRRGRKIIVYGA